jgi:hypothetical protein
MPPYVNRPRRHFTYVRQRSDQLHSQASKADDKMAPTQAPALPVAIPRA